MSRRCREVVIATHPAFEQLSETYKYFREYSSFLYTGDHISCDISKPIPMTDMIFTIPIANTKASLSY